MNETIDKQVLTVVPFAI